MRWRMTTTMPYTKALNASSAENTSPSDGDKKIRISGNTTK